MPWKKAGSHIFYSLPVHFFTDLQHCSILNLIDLSGSSYSERTGDGGYGAGDQHDGDHAQDRGAEQTGERGGGFID
jgi:hypothetical protein